jgi:hypothetical protein
LLPPAEATKVAASGDFLVLGRQADADENRDAPRAI